ncbi:MAG: tripartite tricarboxylate transporter TctB family protein [Burkholderiales bacterium]
MPSIRNPKDFWAGVLFVGLGVGTLAVSAGYTLGTAARMGPGYFPRMLGVLLVTLGLVIGARGLRGFGEAIPAWKWRPTLVVLGSVVLFGLVVAKLGIAVSTVILIVTSSAASHEFRPLEALVTGVLLAALATGVFVVGLHLQLPIWPVFITG